MSDLRTSLINGAASAVVGGVAGWVASTVKYHRERRARRGDDAAASIRRTAELLSDLRSIYQGLAIPSSRWRLMGRKQLSDRSQADAENKVDAACNQSASDELASAVQAYVTVGQAYASRDPDTTAVQENDEWEGLSSVIRRLITEAQSPSGPR